jgi:hypothetical protein
MIAHIGAIGLAAALLVNLVVGLRMAFLGLRTKQSPEILLAILMLLGGVLGLSILNIAQNVTAIPAPTRLVFAAVGLSAQYLAAMSQIAFLWRVFRFGQTPAMVFYSVYATGLVAAYLLDFVSGSWAAYGGGAMTNAGYVPGFALRTGAAILAALEGLRYLVMLRRQLRFALAEPAVVRRFTYYVISMVSMALVYSIGFVHRLLTGESASATPATGLAMGLLAATTAVTLGLAFLRRRATTEVGAHHG